MGVASDAGAAPPEALPEPLTVEDTASRNADQQEQNIAAAASRIRSGALALFPGAVQGASSIIIGHPFDTLKTRMQARSSSGMHVSLLRAARSIARDEGIRAFYRGVSPPLLITSAKRSLQLSAWEALKALPEAHDQSSLFGVLRPAVVSPFGAGAIAGAAGTILGCPMNVIKIQTQNLRREDTLNALTCIVKIAKEDGLRGFYRGLMVQLVKDVAFAAAYLGLYQTTLSALERHFPPTPQPQADVSEHTQRRGSAEHHAKTTTFVAAVVSMMLTWTLLFPIDTVKTFVQARQPIGMLGTEVRGMPLGRAVARLYRGLPAALLRAGPVAGMTMVMYEAAKEFVIGIQDASGGGIR